MTFKCQAANLVCVDTNKIDLSLLIILLLVCYAIVGFDL